MVSTEELEAPLDPNLQYFDATPSIEFLAKQVKDLHNSLKLQLSINASMGQNLQTLHDRVKALEEKRSGSSIIMPGRTN